MVNNIQSVSYSNTVAYFPWATSGPTEVTLAIYGPSGFANYTPPGVAIVDYYDPYSNQVISEVFSIGGTFGASEIKVVTGSLVGIGSGEIKVRIVDNQDIPIGSVLSPGKYLPNVILKLLDIFGYIDDGVSGVFGTTGYYVSQPSSTSTNIFSINPNATYAPGFLESKGISPKKLPSDVEAIYDYNGNFVGARPKNHCFTAGTLIDMWPVDAGIKPDTNGLHDNTEVLSKVWQKSIEEITPDNWVVSFDGNGNLKPGRVVKVFRNITTRLIKVTEIHEGEVIETFVTPGHLFHNELGLFERLESILDRGGAITDRHGRTRKISAEIIDYSEATAHLFEQGEVVRYETAGGLACKPYIERGWVTYNFEVAEYHTYIANGWRVHNDSQVYIDMAGAIGQAFGTQLGMMLTEGKSQFTQLAVGTALGVVTRNLAEVILDTGFHKFTGQQLNFGASLSTAMRQLEDIHVDFATAAAGTVSSFLIAELGEELGLKGFGAQLFNVTASAYAGSVLNTAAANIHKGLPALSGANLTTALNVLPGTVGSFFGSTLANKILPAETLQGTIGGSLGSIAGSALGSTVAASIVSSAGLSAVTTVVANILLPGIGSFIGALLGTFLGDLFFDKDPQGTVKIALADSVDGFGADRDYTRVGSTTWVVDGFPKSTATAWGEAAADAINSYLESVSASGVSNPPIAILGSNDYSVSFYADEDGFYSTGRRKDAEQMVGDAISRYINNAQVVGGDMLMKRAVQNMKTSDISKISEAMAVASEYSRYLEERDIINALIVSQPESVFSAAWTIVLAQAQDLRLTRTTTSDFNGGLGGFLASLAVAGMSVAPGDVAVSRSGTTVTVSIRVTDDFVMPGVASILADKVETVETDKGQFINFSFYNNLAAAGFTNVNGAQGSGSTFEVIGETLGRNVWIAPNGANYVYINPLPPGAEYLLPQPLNISPTALTGSILIGGSGNDRITGGLYSADWISGGAGNDFLMSRGSNSFLFGGDGNDELQAGEGINYLEGGDGADVLYGKIANLGLTIAGYSASNSGVSVNLATGVASGGHATGDRLFNIAGIVGSRFADILIGDKNSNILEGGAGADTLNGGGGTGDVASYAHAPTAILASLSNPSINTGDGAGDTYISIHGLEGSSFDDVLIGNSGSNQLWGNHGNDILVVGAGADLAFGGNGFDVMSYRDLTSGIILNLETWKLSSAIVSDDQAIDIEAFEGTNFNDTMTGRNRRGSSGETPNDVLYGLGGDDTLYGNAGDDALFGGKGIDLLYGGAGDDVLDAGAGSFSLWQYLSGQDGNDTYVIGADNGSVFISALSGRESATEGTDTVVFSDLSIKDLTFGSYDYTSSSPQNGVALDIKWSGGLLRIGMGGRYTEKFQFADGTTLSGISFDTYGNTVFSGTVGADRIVAGTGIDTLYGGSGNDLLDACAGSSSAWQYSSGQGGDDTYVIGSNNGKVFISALAGREGPTDGIDTVVFSDLNIKDLTFGTYDYTSSSPLNGVALDIIWSGGLLEIGMGGRYIEKFQFADGSFVSTIAVSSFEGQALIGTTKGDLLVGKGARLDGMGGNDILLGCAGNDDYLVGGAGNDTIYGGTGSDRSMGQDGDDTYVYRRGDGYDQIYDYTTVKTTATADLSAAAALGVKTNGTVDKWIGGYDWNSAGGFLYKLTAAGTDTLVLEGGIKASDLRFTWAGPGLDNLVIDIAGGPSGDRIYLFQQALAAARIEKIRLDDIGTRNLYVARSSGATEIGSAGDDILFGLGGNEVLNGGAGNDIIYGGLGNDILIGGAGSDTFVFNTALNAPSNKDIISDFNVIDDTIVLENGIFTELGMEGVLEPSAFHIGANAADTSSRIIYNSVTGALLYDADGNDAGAAIQFASIAGGLALTNQNFWIS